MIFVFLCKRDKLIKEVFMERGNVAILLEVILLYEFKKSKSCQFPIVELFDLRIVRTLDLNVDKQLVLSQIEKSIKGTQRDFLFSL